MLVLAACTPLSASLTARSVAIIGTISICTRRFRSSTASTLVGSAIATKSFVSRRAIGTSLCAFAISRGTRLNDLLRHAHLRQD